MLRKIVGFNEVIYYEMMSIAVIHKPMGVITDKLES